MDTKYYLTWEQYKEQHPEVEGLPEEAMAAKLKKNEDALYNFIIGLLM